MNERTKRRSALSWIGLAAILSPAWAQSADLQSPLCRSAERRIEESLKTVSFEGIAGITDNSAARETNRLLRVVGARTEINGQLLVMASLKCAPLTWPLDSGVYLLSAMKCWSAQNVPGGADTKTACDRGTWERMQQKLE